MTPNIQIGTVAQGSSFNVTRTGTNENPILNFTLVRGDKGDVGSQGPVGATGNGIATIVKTSTVGLVDTYTITYTNGNTTTFTVTNGEDGEVTETELNELRQQVEDLEDNQKTNTASGTSIDISDSAKAKNRSIGLTGRSTQESTTGKNLFYISNYSKSGWIITIDNPLKGMSAGDYTISCQNKYASSGKSIRTYFSNAVAGEAIGSVFTDYSFGNTIMNQTKSLTQEQLNADYFILYPNDNQGSQSVLEDMQIMIEQGSTATDYEPYTGGEAAPNPNYPQEIKSCGDNIQLFDKDNANILNATIGTTQGTNYGSIVSSNNGKCFYINCNPNTTYTVSRKAGTRFVVGTTSQIPTIGQVCSDLVINSTSDKITITTGNTAQYLVVYYFLNGTDTLTEQEILDSIKIEQGTKATSWSPFGMGCLTEKIVNKNWFDIVAFENQLVSRKIINDSGNEVSDSTSQYSKYFMFLKANKQYYIKGAWQRMYFYDKNKVFKSRSTAGTGLDRTYIPAEDEYIRFQISTDYWNANKGQEQVELGSTATDYVPHEEQTHTIPTQQPMRSIGDVRDKFNEDNKTEDHYIARKIFDGTEEWTRGQVGNIYRFSTTLSDILAINARNIVLSNYFKYNGDVSVNIHGIIFASNKNIFIYPDENITTVSELKAWIAEKYANGTPLYVDYILAEPINLPYTEEQKEAWEQIKKARTYKGGTHISSEDETPANVELEYVVDVNTIYDRVTALENIINS